MITVAGRSANLSGYLKATSQSIGSRNILAPVTVHLEDHHDVPPKVKPQTSASLAGALPKTSLKATAKAIGGLQQVRWAHTDLKLPNMDKYRKKSNMDPNKKSSETYDDRRVFSYMINSASAVGFALFGKAVAQGLVLSMAPSKAALAAGKIEVKLKDIPEGKNVLFKWNNKPLFVRHRTQAEIAIVRAVDLSELRDPQKDEERVQQADWLVCLGICTHLGCVPIANQGDYGGYYCPCHGSHYDASGRIRKGPAPLNLEVPEYRFENDLLIVG